MSTSSGIVTYGEIVADRAGRCRRLGQVVVVVVAAAALAVSVGPSATWAAPAEPSFSGPVNYPAGVTPQQWWWRGGERVRRGVASSARTRVVSVVPGWLGMPIAVVVGQHWAAVDLELRRVALVAALRDAGIITSASVERALSSVAREISVPRGEVGAAYDDRAIIVKPSTKGNRRAPFRNPRSWPS